MLIFTIYICIFYHIYFFYQIYIYHIYICVYTHTHTHIYVYVLLDEVAVKVFVPFFNQFACFLKYYS